MKVVGIDLAGTEKRETGFCFLHDNKIKTFVVKSDAEIIKITKKIKPKIIGIDAPLSLPLRGKNRRAEEEIRKMKIRIFPPLFGAMKKLTYHGIKLKSELVKLGFDVIEVYPGAFYDIFKIPRKNNIKYLTKKFRIKINKKANKISQHEADALASAIMAKLYLNKKHVAVGDKEEGQIILPKNDEV